MRSSRQKMWADYQKLSCMGILLKDNFSSEFNLDSMLN